MLALLFREMRCAHRPEPCTISFAQFREIFVVGMPAAIQCAVFCFANLFVTASVNSFGAVAASGRTISINYEYITYYIITTFGQTATTFTGQNHAAGYADRCRAILKHCLVLDILFTALMTVPMTIFPRFFASLFSSDPAVIEMAGLRIRIILAIEPLCAVYEVLSGVLRGKGYSLQPAITAMAGICVTRILWILLVFRQLHTLPSLFIIFPSSWIITNILMIITYRRLSSHECSL